jgi:DNA polymerase-4
MTLGDVPFCRDCLARAEPAARRCAACGSPRLLAHPEHDRLGVAHIDCDAFYASVEKRDDPALRDKPLIIGGGKRGVVSTACYIARTFGVRSAMPMFKARALCPDAIVVKPDMAKYVAVGREIRDMMRALTPAVEPLSIDEAFLDLTGTERLHGAPPAFVLADLARRVEREIGVTVSIGLSDCKFLAKLASDMDKPRGFAIIGRAEALSVLAPMPIGRICGVGRVAQERFGRDGLHMIRDVQALDEIDMMRRHGDEGRRIWRLSHAIDHRRVSPDRETKSISSETTFNDDLSSEDVLVPILHALCERVSARAKKAELAGRSITLKLKTRDFRLRTRSRSGLAPTQLAARLFRVSRGLLLPELDGTAFRLIGVGLSDLVPASEADHADLADQDVVREKATETAMDRIRTRFGGDAIIRGIAFKRRR